MATVHTPQDDGRHHTRTKSAFRTFMHKRSPSKGTPLSSTPSTDIFVASPAYEQPKSLTILPPGHLHSRALGEIQQNQQKSPEEPQSPRKIKDGERSKSRGDGFKYLHKKTLSSISLRSLSGKDSENKQKEEKGRKPKKAKSSTNLAALLTRSRSSKSLRKAAAEAELASPKDKENQSPYGLRTAESPSRPPIYAQFSSQHFAIQPLGGRFLEDEVDVYTPTDYSSDKQFPFYDEEGFPPTLDRREGSRPNSLSIPSSYIVQEFSRPSSSSGSAGLQGTRPSRSLTRQSYQRQVTACEPKSEQKVTSNRESTLSKRGAKVMAAVASSFNVKSKEVDSKPDFSQDIKDIDAEFEAMLDRRNIPENQRYKMRSLANTMKIDFIRQDWAETAAARKNRPGTNSSMESVASALTIEDSASEKAKRPRSRTFTGFTLSKSSKKTSDAATSPKKNRPEAVSKHTRSKSSDSTGDKGKLLSTASVAVASSLIAKAKGQSPEDFVAYLRKVQRPESVEVGKLHKLRLLLRNETVAWTDEFIGLGGMQEIISLLHRIMAVEWREEHEDALLHESLLCLKALCTTGLALSHLAVVQSSLFPALLHMIFDEEKKGPSEFSTRTIITSLLFAYLQSGPYSERQFRAETLLSYLRDPQPKEEERPVPFVLQMHQERPYRVWCKEVVNVTKEVFWIFLHTLNVIALPMPDLTDTVAGQYTSGSNRNSTGAGAFGYMEAHFPTPLPPLPTAPYVGGVEWEATNYITSHLFLLNGILASLPLSSRNELRAYLRISGWERCMGGSLRTCKEKFYGGVHAALRDWVSAAAADGWEVSNVRFGAKSEESPRKSPSKKNLEDAPKIEMPKLDFEIARGTGEKEEEAGWL